MQAKLVFTIALVGCAGTTLAAPAKLSFAWTPFLALADETPTTTAPPPPPTVAKPTFRPHFVNKAGQTLDGLVSIATAPVSPRAAFATPTPGVYRIGYNEPKKDVSAAISTITNDLPPPVTTTVQGAAQTWFPLVMTIPVFVYEEEGDIPDSAKGPSTTMYDYPWTAWYTGTETPAVPATTMLTQIFIRVAPKMR